mgnify:CR=1 FL=1
MSKDKWFVKSKIIKKCRNCGKEFFTFPSVNRIFCSRACYSEFRRFSYNFKQDVI